MFSLIIGYFLLTSLTIYELLEGLKSILFEIISYISSLAQAVAFFTAEKAQKIQTLNLRWFWGEKMLYVHTRRTLFGRKLFYYA